MKETRKPQRQKWCKWGIKTLQIESELYKKYGIMGTEELTIVA